MSWLHQVNKMKSAKLNQSEKVGRGHPPKVHQFKKGQSGNPGGRPKGSVKISSCYERSLSRPYPNDPEGRTYAQVIADKTVELAAKGEIAAIREVTDRLEGKAKQSIENTGDVRVTLPMIYNLLNGGEDEKP
jgi:hypothetical protein